MNMRRCRAPTWLMRTHASVHHYLAEGDFPGSEARRTGHLKVGTYRTRLQSPNPLPTPPCDIRRTLHFGLNMRERSR